MFRQILFMNWKATRLGLLPFMMAAMGLPLLTVQSTRILPGFQSSTAMRSSGLLHSVAEWAHLYPVLAFALGTVMALMVWNWDHRGEHVYPLTLPLPRWKYVLMKMGAGSLLLLIPAAVFWLGSLIAVSLVDIPEGLRGYPTALAFRFLLGTLLAYGIFFAMAAGTMRTAILLLTAWILLLFLGETVPALLGRLWGIPSLADFRFLRWFLTAAMSWPGPFEVPAGNWMLIDA